MQQTMNVGNISSKDQKIRNKIIEPIRKFNPNVKIIRPTLEKKTFQ